jgi:glutathione S-transferase
VIKLYGLKMSNYYSLSKALMIEKDVEFEEVKTPPSQNEDFLSKSPMGKMPAIEVDGVFLSESMAIAQYVEEVGEGDSLFPEDAMEAAKVTELILHIKLDVELVARRCLPEAFFGQTVSDEIKELTRVDLEKGMKAVARLFEAPTVGGDTPNLADFYTFYSFGLASGIAKSIWNIDLLEGYPQIAAVMTNMAQHPSVARVEAEKSVK